MSDRLAHFALMGALVVALLFVAHLLLVLAILPALAAPDTRWLYIRFTVFFSIVGGAFGFVVWTGGALAGIWFYSLAEFVLSVLALWSLLALNAGMFYLAIRLLVR